MGTKGYKSTEFWLTVAANLIGVLMMSGAFPSESGYAQALGMAASLLSTMGYQHQRSKVKAKKLEADAIAAGVVGGK